MAQHQDVRQQWSPRQADGLHGSQQAAHQQDLCHEDLCQPQQQVFNAHAELDDVVQDHARNWENASSQERSSHGPEAATSSSYPINGVLTDQQRHAQSPQPAGTLLEATHKLLSQVQSCHTQLTHELSLRTSHWPNQVNELLCYALNSQGQRMLLIRAVILLMYLKTCLPFDPLLFQLPPLSQMQSLTM